MPGALDVHDIILNFDPAAPQPRFRAAGLEAALAPAGAALPHAIPWPAGAAPTPVPLNPAPAATDDLSRFHGYDAVVATWTAAEASAMAALFTPGHPTASWYEYRHNVPAYIPLKQKVLLACIAHRQADDAVPADEEPFVYAPPLPDNVSLAPGEPLPTYRYPHGEYWRK